MGRVQTSGKQQTATGGTAVTFNAGADFTVGNWVVACWETTPYKDSVTSGAGTTVEHAIATPFGAQLLGITSFKVTTPGHRDLTFNFPSGTTNGVTCSFEEWDNFDPTTPLDSVPAEVAGLAITSATLAQANEVVYAVAMPNGVGGSAPGGPAGFTQTWQEGSGSFVNGAAGYLEVSATTPVTATFTNVGSCLMATFKTSGGGGGGSTAGKALRQLLGAGL